MSVLLSFLWLDYVHIVWIHHGFRPFIHRWTFRRFHHFCLYVKVSSVFLGKHLRVKFQAAVFDLLFHSNCAISHPFSSAGGVWEVLTQVLWFVHPHVLIFNMYSETLLSWWMHEKVALKEAAKWSLTTKSQITFQNNSLPDVHHAFVSLLEMLPHLSRTTLSAFTLEYPNQQWTTFGGTLQAQGRLMALAVLQVGDWDWLPYWPLWAAPPKHLFRWTKTHQWGAKPLARRGVWHTSSSADLCWSEPPFSPLLP